MNTLSKEILSIRPPEFEEDEDQSNNLNVEEVDNDPANGLPSINISELNLKVDEIINDLKQTPLLIDTSREQNVKTFYSYKGKLEDISCLTVPFGKSGIKRENIMERCRERLVAAMKTGDTFCLYLGECSIEHCDLKNKLCKKVMQHFIIKFTGFNDIKNLILLCRTSFQERHSLKRVKNC